MQTKATYYTINEDAARHANDLNSFSNYIPGSATAEYRKRVDEAIEIAERQKKRVDPEYHDKIDYLLDLYARKLAENMNQSYAIESRVPSVLIAGPSNFPVRRKHKQNAARGKNMEEWQHIQGFLDKIKSTGIPIERIHPRNITGRTPGFTSGGMKTALSWRNGPIIHTASAAGNRANGLSTLPAAIISRRTSAAMSTAATCRGLSKTPPGSIAPSRNSAVTTTSAWKWFHCWRPIWDIPDWSI